MSILIKGIEMPKRCEDCVMYRHNAEYDYAYCCISSVNVLGHGNARLNNCPLIEVPTQHGRLIDADAIEYTHAIARCIEDGHNWNELCVTADEICDMPTIIEAEEGEKGCIGS